MMMPPKPPSLPAMPQSKAPKSNDKKEYESGFETGSIPFLPPKICVYAQEGWGKTSLAAYSSNPAILMARGEKGYYTLLGNKLVPDVMRRLIETWDELMTRLTEIANTEDPPMDLLALDGIGGFERIGHEHHCEVEYNGDMGPRGFMNYHKGYDSFISEWLKMLNLLDQINNKGVIILLLGHTTIKTFQNPLGEDYDRFITNVHPKTWMPTHRWCDAVLFGCFHTTVDVDKDNRKRGVGTDQRLCYTTRRDTWDAKNRYNMPSMIQIPSDPSQIWETIWNNMIGGNGK